MYTETAKSLARERRRYLDEFFEQLIAEINGDR